MESEKRLICKIADERHTLKSPPFIQLELTNSCNQRCMHCYNYWRNKPHEPKFITLKQAKFLLDEFRKNQVQHVVLSGGEPLLNYKTLLFLVKELTKNRISVSLNSNLTLATHCGMKKLRKAGLPHILTSLNADNASTNRKITSTDSFNDIIKGIKTAIKAGIHVSVNMVITKFNLDNIHSTAKLARKLGCRNFNITRNIPVVHKTHKLRKMLELTPKETRRMLDIGLKIDEEMDFDKVSTMIPLPYCFLGDLKKYKIYLEKCACVAGTKLMSISSSGDVHGCVHEAKTYGNIFNLGLKKAWQRMIRWHTLSYFPVQCRECRYFDSCVAGCRMAARACTRIDGFDSLRRGGRCVKHYSNTAILSKKYILNPNLRCRRERGFHYITTFGANGVVVSNDIIRMLKRYKKPFRLSHTIELKMAFNDLIVPEDDKRLRQRRQFV